MHTHTMIHPEYLNFFLSYLSPKTRRHRRALQAEGKSVHLINCLAYIGLELAGAERAISLP